MRMRLAVLLVAALALPAAALADTASGGLGTVTVAHTADAGQVIAIDTYDPPTQTSYLNASHCPAGGVVPVEWNLQVVGGLPFTGTGAYQIFATDTQPTTDTTTGGTFCAEVNDVNKSPPVHAAQVGAFPVTGTSGIQDGSVSASDVVAAAGFTCAGSESKTVYLCAHWVDANNVRRGFAAGRFVVQTLAPSPPTGVTVAVADGKLVVSWTQSADGSGVATPAYYVAEATTATDGGGTMTHYAPSTTGTTATIDGLTNGTAYEVAVVAYSVGGNPSAPSATITETPLAWEAPVGSRPDDGGCASGPGGALALLGAAAALFVTRTRARAR